MSEIDKYYRNMEPHVGKLKSLTLVEKLKLIEIVEMGRPVKDVAEEFAVNRNTLHYILKNRDKIREGIIANPGIAGFKRIKQTKSPALEQRVLDFMLDSRANDQKLSGSIIKTVALEIAAELGVENFGGSNGWLHSFFKRNRININDFNKGVDPYSYNEESSINDSKIIVENYHENFDENDQVEITEHADSPNDMKDMYDVEMIEEDPQEIVQDQEDHIDVFWKNWCRLCGNCETLSEQEPQHTEIVEKLLNVSSTITYIVSMLIS